MLMCIRQVFTPMSRGFLASRLKQRLTRCEILLGNITIVNSCGAAVTMAVLMTLTPWMVFLSRPCIVANVAASLLALVTSVPSLASAAAWAAAEALFLAGWANWVTAALNPLQADPQANCWIICFHNVPVLLVSPVKAQSTFWNHWMISRGVSLPPSNTLKANLTFVELASMGSLRRSIWTRSSFLFTNVGSGTNGSKGLLLFPKSLDTEIFLVGWS